MNEAISIIGCVTGIIGTTLASVTLYLLHAYRPKIKVGYVGLGDGEEGSSGTKRNIDVEISNNRNHPATIRNEAKIKYIDHEDEYSVKVMSASNKALPLIPVRYGITEKAQIRVYPNSIALDQRRSLLIERLSIFCCNTQKHIAFSKEDVERINRDLKEWLKTG